LLKTICYLDNKLCYKLKLIYFKPPHHCPTEKQMTKGCGNVEGSVFVGAAVGVATTKIPKPKHAEQMLVGGMLLTAQNKNF
jgi:hypothetical protein